MIDREDAVLSVDEIMAFRERLEQQLTESHEAVQAGDTGTVILDQTQWWT